VCLVHLVSDVWLVAQQTVVKVLLLAAYVVQASTVSAAKIAQWVLFAVQMLPLNHSCCVVNVQRDSSKYQQVKLPAFHVHLAKHNLSHDLPPACSALNEQPHTLVILVKIQKCLLAMNVLKEHKPLNQVLHDALFAWLERLDVIAPPANLDNIVHPKILIQHVASRVQQVTISLKSFKHHAYHAHPACTKTS